MARRRAGRLAGARLADRACDITVRALLRRISQLVPRPAKDYLRASRLFQRLLWVAYPERKQSFDLELRFLEGLFASLGRRPRMIFDIGANAGEKTIVYQALGAAVVAVEPTPDLAAHLRERFRRDPRVTVAECAVSATSGTATLFRVNRFNAMNTISNKNVDIIKSGVNPRTPDRSLPEVAEEIKVVTTTLDDLIRESARPDYVKIDVEGHEKEVMAGLGAPVPLLSFECILPEFLHETFEVIDRLCELDPRTRFQAREHEGFIYPDWMSADAIKDAVRSGKPYLELYAVT
jgi:FkbM family methyltransferase